MITPIEIQNKSFKSGGLGYDKRDVDQFMKELLSGYESLYRENVEMKDKISSLTDALQQYKYIEKTLQKALILAEKTAEDTKQLAQKEAKRIEKEAQLKYQIVLGDAKNELNRIHKQTMKLMQQYEMYRAQFKNLANAQIELIESESFGLSIANVDELLGEPIEEEKPAEDRVNSEDFWNNPLVDIDRYLDDESPAVSDVIEGQEELSFINLEEESDE